MSDLLTRIKSVKIFPAIGIARVGNSPTEFFIGPERVGETSAPEGGFKDAQGRIKRQAARFRIFGYDATGTTRSGDYSARTRPSPGRFISPTRKPPGSSSKDWTPTRRFATPPSRIARAW